MKKGLIALFVVLCGFGTASFAQTIDISTAKSSLNTSASDLDQLMTKVNDIKAKAEAQFKSEADAIAAKKTELASRRSAIEADNGKEKDMMADAWPQRVAAREALVREEAKVMYDEQVLAAKKADFSHRIKQVEQHIQSTFVEVIKTQNNQNDSVMKAYLNSLGGFEI